MLVGGEGELLAEEFVLLNLATESTFSLRRAPAAGKSCGIEFKNEPPIDRVTLFQEWHWSLIYWIRPCQTTASRWSKEKYKDDTKARHCRAEKEPNCMIWLHIWLLNLGEVSI